MRNVFIIPTLVVLATIAFSTTSFAQQKNDGENADTASITQKGHWDKQWDEKLGIWKDVWVEQAADQKGHWEKQWDEKLGFWKDVWVEEKPAS